MSTGAVGQEATGEDIIRAWIHAKCDPSPYSAQEAMRRAMRGFVEVIEALEAAVQAHQLVWEAFIDAVALDPDTEWELAK